MSSAHIESIEVITAVRIALVKFAEAANVAMGEAESDLLRTMSWLEMDMKSHWAGEFRKRTEALSKAKDALRQKQMYYDATGSKPSAVDELKAVQIATRRLEEAEYKIAAVAKYRRMLEKETEQYKGLAQRFATTVQIEIPSAIARLSNIALKLEEYLSTAPSDISSAAPASSDSTPSTAPAIVEPPPASPTEDPHGNV